MVSVRNQVIDGKQNMMKLNAEKTESILYKSKRMWKRLMGRAYRLVLLKSKIVLKLKILGVIFGQSLSIQFHMNTGVRVGYLYMCKIARFYHFRDKEVKYIKNKKEIRARRLLYTTDWRIQNMLLKKIQGWSYLCDISIEIYILYVCITQRFELLQGKALYKYVLLLLWI